MLRERLKTATAMPASTTIPPPTEMPRPAFCTIDYWVSLSGMGRRSTYAELGRENLKAIKVGSRTLINVEAGLAWLRSRPPAIIRAPVPRKQLARAMSPKEATE
jgi:hypothetical protein